MSVLVAGEQLHAVLGPGQGGYGGTVQIRDCVALHISGVTS